MVKGFTGGQLQGAGFGLFGTAGLVFCIYIIRNVYKVYKGNKVKIPSWRTILFLLGVIGGGLLASYLFTNKKIKEWEKNPGSGGMKYWLNKSGLSFLRGIGINWFIILVFGVFLLVWVVLLLLLPRILNKGKKDELFDVFDYGPFEAFDYGVEKGRLDTSKSAPKKEPLRMVR